MKDICEATGMSMGGLYSHFGSTREGFEAILEKINQKDEMNFQKGLAQTGGRANIGKFMNGLLFYHETVKR